MNKKECNMIVESIFDALLIDSVIGDMPEEELSEEIKYQIEKKKEGTNGK